MNKAQRDMIMTVRQLRRVIVAGERTVDEINRIKGEIAQDRSRSEEWKREKTAAAQKEQNEQLRELGAEAATLIDRFMEQVEAARQSFDYRDSDFTKAVGLVNALGKAMPVDLSMQISDSFKGNLGAMKALKAVYSANGIDTQHLDGLIKPLDSLGFDDNGAITEFLGYARSDLIDANEWRSGAIKHMLDKYEKPTTRPKTSRNWGGSQQREPVEAGEPARPSLANHREGPSIEPTPCTPGDLHGADADYAQQPPKIPTALLYRDHHQQRRAVSRAIEPSINAIFEETGGKPLTSLPPMLYNGIGNRKAPAFGLSYGKSSRVASPTREPFSSLAAVSRYNETCNSNHDRQ